MDKQIIVREMVPEDILAFHQGFKDQGWDKPVEQFERYYEEQESQARKLVVAEYNGNVAGYATLLPNDESGPFANMHIPTVCDFNVLIPYQKRGIGSAIMDRLEELAKQVGDRICLGVGLHNGYGSAQRMYVKRGYIPDGSGVWYRGVNLQQYADCNNDDDLVLYLSKEL